MFQKRGKCGKKIHLCMHACVSMRTHSVLHRRRNKPVCFFYCLHLCEKGWYAHLPVFTHCSFCACAPSAVSRLEVKMRMAVHIQSVGRNEVEEEKSYQTNLLRHAHMLTCIHSTSCTTFVGSYIEQFAAYSIFYAFSLSYSTYLRAQKWCSCLLPTTVQFSFIGIVFAYKVRVWFLSMWVENTCVKNTSVHFLLSPTCISAMNGIRRRQFFQMTNFRGKTLWWRYGTSERSLRSWYKLWTLLSLVVSQFFPFFFFWAKYFPPSFLFFIVDQPTRNTSNWGKSSQKTLRW